MKSLILSVLLLLGCVTVPLDMEQEPSVFVSFDGVGVIKVWVQINGGTPTRLGTVQSGLPACFRLPKNYGVMTLWAGELGSRDVVKSPDFDGTYTHWVWTLASHLTTTRINLVPADHSCFSRKTRDT